MKMAERNNRTLVDDGRKPSNSANKRGSAKNTNVNKLSTKDLLSREEEYKRLNEELEAKTATLVKEAETVISEQSDLLTKPSLLDNLHAEDFYAYEYGDLDDYDGNLNSPQEQASRSSTVRSPGIKVTNHTRPLSQAKLATNARPHSVKGKKPNSGRNKVKSKSNLADDVAVPDDTFLTEFQDFSLHKTISNIEGKLDSGQLQDADDDVMPSAATEMGAEAQIRFLKAKLRVMQEELDRLAAECMKKDEHASQLATKLKDAEEERSRLQRTSTAQQTQIEKYKRLAEDAKGKADSLDNTLSGVKKELESIKRVQKQQTSTQGATEVRLNRALEEVEKYKTQLNKSKSQSKDSVEGEKRKVEQLLAENKRLEKQKNELMAGFKKQLKLIDILKRQKMHIEAAKMLSFTEEEFVKALEWGQ